MLVTRYTQNWRRTGYNTLGKWNTSPVNKTRFTNYFNRTTENSQLTFRRVAWKLCAANHSLSRSSLLTVSTCSMGRAMVSILLTLSYALSRSWVTEICQYFYFQLLLNFSNRFFLLFFTHFLSHFRPFPGPWRFTSCLKSENTRKRIKFQHIDFYFLADRDRDRRQKIYFYF